jgi:large conductance mechanosensitive channel
VGAWITAVISFAVLATVVYFFIVLPYTRAKERYFPSPEPGTPEDVKLLQEIRDLLVAQQVGPPATITPPADPPA